MVDVGLNWYLNKFLKIYLDWEHAMFASPVFYNTGRFQKSNDLLLDPLPGLLLSRRDPAAPWPSSRFPGASPNTPAFEEGSARRPGHRGRLRRCAGSLRCSSFRPLARKFKAQTVELTVNYAEAMVSKTFPLTKGGYRA